MPKVAPITARASRSASAEKPVYRPSENELTADEISLRHRHAQLPAIREKLLKQALKDVIDDFAACEDEALNALAAAFSGRTRKFVNGAVNKASLGRNYSYKRMSRSCS